jgi:hypothetical protein
MNCKGSQPTAMLVLLCVFAKTLSAKKTLKPSRSASSLFQTELCILCRVKEHGLMEIDFAELWQYYFNYVHGGSKIM